MRTLLLLLALLPPIFLMYRVYKADKVEKEPVGLVLKLFLLVMNYNKGDIYYHILFCFNQR